MAANDPNQIDISLSLLGADSPAVLTSLVQTLQGISKTMDTLKGSLPGGVEGSWRPVTLPQADGSAASRPIAGASPEEGARQPSRPPDADFIQMYSRSPSVTYPDYTPAEVTPGRYDETWARQKLTQYRDLHPKSDESLASRAGATLGQGLGAAADVIQQRVGSATTQTGGFLSAFKEDPAGLMNAMTSSMTSWGGEKLSRTWSEVRGISPDNPNADNPNAFQQVKNIGINLAGAPWVLQNMMKVLPTTLPMLADPRALNQIGGETGRDTFGTRVGPFTLPYTSEASRFGVNQATQSFWEGLTTPGLSGKDIMNIRKNLSSLGWGGQDKVGDLDRMSNVLKQIQQHQKGLDIGTTAAMMDKSMRWGGHSLDEFKKTILSLQPAARAAKMDLGEFQKAVSDAGGAAVQAGADYLTGVKHATQFSQMSGLPPQLYGQFIQSPWVQANLMGTTGALPWEQGMLSPDTTLMSGMNVANMLTDTFMNARSHGLTYRDASGRKRHLSSFQLGTAGAANVLGMSPQELRKMERNRQLMPQRARAYDDLHNYVKDAHGGDEKSTWMKLQNEILRGHYHGKDDVNMGSWMRQKLTHIYNSTKGHPHQRAEETRKLLEKTMKNAPTTTKSGVSISLAGDAARYFRLNTDKLKAKRAVNAGSASTTNSQGMPGNPSPIPFDPHRYAADPYNPQTGTGYAPDGSVPTNP